MQFMSFPATLVLLIDNVRDFTSLAVYQTFGFNWPNLLCAWTSPIFAVTGLLSSQKQFRDDIFVFGSKAPVSNMQ